MVGHLTVEGKKDCFDLQHLKHICTTKLWHVKLKACFGAPFLCTASQKYPVDYNTWFDHVYLSL